MLLREQAKLIFLRTRSCPKGLKEEIIRQILPNIDMHSPETKKIIEKFNSILNSDRDKLNTSGQLSANKIIEVER